MYKIAHQKDLPTGLTYDHTRDSQFGVARVEKLIGSLGGS